MKAPLEPFQREGATQYTVVHGDWFRLVNWNKSTSNSWNKCFFKLVIFESALLWRNDTALRILASAPKKKCHKNPSRNISNTTDYNIMPRSNQPSYLLPTHRPPVKYQIGNGIAIRMRSISLTHKSSLSYARKSGQRKCHYKSDGVRCSFTTFHCICSPCILLINSPLIPW